MYFWWFDFGLWRIFMLWKIRGWWHWRRVVFLWGKFDSLFIVVWWERWLILHFENLRGTCWGHRLYEIKDTWCSLLLTDLICDFFDLIFDFEWRLWSIDELLDDLSVDVVSGLLLDVKGESGCLFVDYVFFATN